MTDTTPTHVLSQYRVRPGADEEFLELLERHWATLRELDLVAEGTRQSWIGSERGLDGSYVVEVYAWTSPDAVKVAHTHPAVSAVWERMGVLCESRGGRPMFDFPGVAPLHA
jgi:hypothetical protein